jgi:cytochrome P450
MRTWWKNSVPSCPIHVIMGIMDLPKEDYSQFQEWYRAAAAYVGNYAQDPAVAATGVRAKQEMDGYLSEVISARRAYPHDDLISGMCTAEIDGVRMSDQEIVDFCSLLLAAGGETTERGIASTLSNLLTNPDQLALVRSDPRLLDAAFAEAIRLNPPTHIILRQLTEDVEMTGARIPEGAVVFCLVGAANRDDRRFQAPDTYNVRRGDLDVSRAFTAGANHLAFGAGRHFCVGAVLAKAEAEIGLEMLLDTLPDLRLVDGFVPVEDGLLTRAPRSLQTVFSPVT